MILLHPFGINLFACSDLANPIVVQKIVDQVIHIFDRLFEVTRATPLIIQYLRNCTHTLISNPGYTMADIPLLLRNKNSRSRLVANVRDRNVLGFWQDYEEMKPSDQRAEREPILRRLEELLQPLTFNIVGQSTTTIDIKQVMDEGKILLVTLSAQLPYVSSLIGSILVALFLNAATNREANKRRQFNLYADEFQRFATEDFATLLEEARKFGLSINMAHQNGNQLEPSLKERARSVANLVVFQVSRKDADELAGGLAQKPDEARIEMLKPQEHRRVEEQVIDGVEPIMTIPHHPFDHLLRGHGNQEVNRLTARILKPLANAMGIAQAETEQADVWTQKVSQEQVFHHRSDGAKGIEYVAKREQLLQGKQHIDGLLFDLMQGSIQYGSREMRDRLWKIVKALRAFIGFAQGARWNVINETITWTEMRWSARGQYPVTHEQSASRGDWVDVEFDSLAEQYLPDLVDAVVSQVSTIVEDNTLVSLQIARTVEPHVMQARLLCHLQETKEERDKQVFSNLSANKEYYDYCERYAHRHQLIKYLSFECLPREKKLSRIVEINERIQLLKNEQSGEMDYINDQPRITEHILPETIAGDPLSAPLGLTEFARHEWLRVQKMAIQEFSLVAGAECRRLIDFLTGLCNICVALSIPEQHIKVQSGQYQPRIRTQVNWLTDESEKITHPQRTEQDMVNEMARILTNLPLHTARVKVVTGNGIEEHTIRTLDPKQSSDKPLYGQTLEDRIAHIKERNMQYGYLRELVDVEAEIRQRQEQYNQPPDIEQPISRHPQH